MMPRLVTIPFSHFCEKARWGLDRAHVPYLEEAHLPLFSWGAALRAGRRRTVPSLVTGEGAIADSTDILRWCDRHGDAPPLFDDRHAEIAELEARFDAVLGPHSRRLAYGHVLPILKDLVGMARGVPRAEVAIARTLARPIAGLMKRGLGIEPHALVRSRKKVDEIFDEVERRLGDGRAFLCGDRFSAADLTFAALATPVLAPPELADFLPVMVGAEEPRRGGWPPAMMADVLAYRATVAGRFAMRLYTEERGRPGATAAAA